MVHKAQEETKAEYYLEKGLFYSRWIMTPFYVGLMAAIALLLIKFFQEFAHMAERVLSMRDTEVIIGVLAMVDMALVANLLLIVAYVGYNHFVSKLGSTEHKDHPAWLNKIDYAGLKIKVMGSIAAITAIKLLRVFMAYGREDNPYTEHDVMWMLIIHIGIAITGVLAAWMDKVAHESKGV